MLKRLLLTCALLLTSFVAVAGQDTLLPLAVRTATNTGADQYRTIETGIHLIVNVTVAPGSDTVTPKIQGKDNLGNYYDLLVGPAISTTGTTVLKIGKGIVGVANASAADIVPDVYRVVVTHSASSSFTYSVTITRN